MSSYALETSEGDLIVTVGPNLSFSLMNKDKAHEIRLTRAEARALARVLLIEMNITYFEWTESAEKFGSSDTDQKFLDLRREKRGY